MNIKYENKKLYLYPTPEERIRLIPLIPSAKMDRVTGTMAAPVSSLLPMLIVAKGYIKPDNKEAEHLLQEASRLLSNIETLKKSVTDKNRIELKSYPFLMKHQAICNKLADVRNRYAFYLDTGTR